MAPLEGTSAVAAIPRELVSTLAGETVAVPLATVNVTKVLAIGAPLASLTKALTVPGDDALIVVLERAITTDPADDVVTLVDPPEDEEELPLPPEEEEPYRLLPPPPPPHATISRAENPATSVFTQRMSQPPF